MSSGFDPGGASVVQAGLALDAFADVTEDDLLRAGWLLTGDPEAATTLTASALATASRHWKTWQHDQPRLRAFAALDAATVKHLSTSAAHVRSPRPATTDPIAVQQRAAEQAFALLPMLERRCVVMRDYANLPSRAVAHIVGGSRRQVDEAADRGLQLLRAGCTDLVDLPFDTTTCPATPPTRDLVRSIAAQKNSITRRQMIAGAAAGLGLAAAGTAAWWVMRPPTGRATIDQALKPLDLRNSGLIFTWTRFNREFRYGWAELLAVDSEGGQSMLLSNRGELSLIANGKPTPLTRTPWQAWTYEAGRTMDARRARVLIARVPLDTNAAWAIVEDGIGETIALGTELADHSTYAVGWVFQDGAINGLLWRTGSQQIGLSNGERADTMSAGDGPTLFVMPRTKVWGVIDAANESAQTLPIDATSAGVTAALIPDGSYYTALLLPRGATDVQVERSPRAATAIVASDPLGRSGFVGVVAYVSSVDLNDANDPGFDLIGSVSWTIDGRRQTWRHHVPEP